MKQVTLYFPSTLLMSEFLLSSKLSGIETNSWENSLTGAFSEQQIADALLYYKATLPPFQVEDPL